MDNILLSLNVVAPICFMMLLGFLLHKVGWIDEGNANFLNRLVFNLLLPVLLFLNISQASWDNIFNWKVFLWVFSSIVTLFLILCLTIPRLERDPQKIPVIIQGIYRSNFVIFGISIAISIYGSGEIAVIALLVALVSPMFNIMAALVFARYNTVKSNAGGLLKDIATNPLVIGSVLGLLGLLTGLKLPGVIHTPLNALGDAASVLGLLALGSGFKVKNLKQNWRILTVTTVGKLIIVPAVFLPLSVLLGFRGVELVGLLVLYASPAAFSGYAMASLANADGELAGQVIVLSSVFSVITVFLMVLILKYFSLI